MKISQLFYSLQGEGFTSGDPAFFIRFPNCNLNCGAAQGAEWVCDSLAQWNSSEEVTVDQLWKGMIEAVNLSEEDLLVELETGRIRVVFTGGEPLLLKNKEYIKEITAFFSTKMKRTYYEVETNGTLKLSPSEAFDLFGERNPVQINCSPKLSNSGIDRDKRINIGALVSLFTNYEVSSFFFKFVVNSEADVQEAIDLIKQLSVQEDVKEDRLSLGDIYKCTMLMPAGATRDEIIKMSPLVWDWCAKYRLKFSSRLHIIAFDKRIDV